MKKIVLFVASLLVTTFSVNAGTIVGNEDNTSGWWSAFTDYYTLKGNGTHTLKFTNYSSKANNWNNWVVVVASDADRGADGYLEYFVVRSDNYGWGGNYAAENLTCNFADYGWDWDAFKENMDGSKVVMTVTRTDDKITMHAESTSSDGTVTYIENYDTTVSDLPETIRYFLTVDGSHYDIESVEFASSIKPISVSKSTENSLIYNVAGQKVGKNAKGLIIKDGRKLVK